MKIYHLLGDFDKELLNDFILFLNDTDNTKPLSIYLTSGGGQVWVGKQLLDLISNYEGEITLIASHKICSSAFDLFYTANVNKYILPDTFGMCHETTWSIEITPSLRPCDAYEEFKQKFLKSDKALDTMHELVKFTPKELKLMKDNKDVWFDTKRLNQMLKYNKKTLS